MYDEICFPVGQVDKTLQSLHWASIGTCGTQHRAEAAVPGHASVPVESGASRALACRVQHSRVELIEKSIYVTSSRC